MLSEALRLMRVFHDLSQKEMAGKLGVAKSYVSEIESGKKVPTLTLLEKYADVFGVPPSNIMFFSENLESDTTGERARHFLSKKILSLMDFIAERSRRAHAE
jgi:transcriptional regulator with XRE-family HTH domain